MAQLSELSGANSALASALAAGVETLSGGQTVTFTHYDRHIIPIDGYVYWVATLDINNNPVTKTIRGSVHYSDSQERAADEVYTSRYCVFTAESQIDDFEAIDSSQLWIGTIDGFQFAFGGRDSLYKQANLFHYIGKSLSPAFAAQVVSTPGSFDASSVVVSNSLPAWLTMTSVAPVYPAFLSPENRPLPFITANVLDNTQKALQAEPIIDPATGSQYQLVSETVEFITYGLRNAQIMDFYKSITDYIRNESNYIGLMNSPVIKDIKKASTEFDSLANKKSISITINYYQAAVRAQAIRYITSALSSFYIQ